MYINLRKQSLKNIYSLEVCKPPSSKADTAPSKRGWRGKKTSSLILLMLVEQWYDSNNLRWWLKRIDWCQEYYEHYQRLFQGRKDKYCCPVYVNQARWGEVSLGAYPSISTNFLPLKWVPTRIWGDSLLSVNLIIWQRLLGVVQFTRCTNPKYLVHTFAPKFGLPSISPCQISHLRYWICSFSPNTLSVKTVFERRNYLELLNARVRLALKPRFLSKGLASQSVTIWVILRCWGKSSMVCQQNSDAL